MLPASAGRTTLRFGDAAQSLAAVTLPRVRREADQPAVLAVVFPGQLTDGQLAVGGHLGGAGVADVGVVRPHHDSAGSGPPCASRWATSAPSVCAMCLSRMFHDVTRPRNMLRY